MNDNLKRLWAAVLIQAIRDYLCVNKGRSARMMGMLHRDADAWIFSNRDSVTGFIEVCEFLGFDPAIVRWYLQTHFSIDELMNERTE